jgi:hypothetical protein
MREQVVITFSADSKDWSATEEVKIGSGSEDIGSYFTSSLVLVVGSYNVRATLVQIDAMKDGLLSGMEDFINNIFNDITHKVVYKESDSLIEVNKYLHNKIQEQERRMEMMEAQNAQMVGIITKYNLKLTEIDDRLRGHMAFMHTYIDIKKIAILVKQIAEKVDPDLIEDFEVVSIH